jgi:hypothetical protein
MIVKLTDANYCTYNNTKWGEGVTHTALGIGKLDLCTNGWIHYYEDEFIAVIRYHADTGFNNPVAFEFIPQGEIMREPLKSGTKCGTTIRIIELPIITSTQKIRFAIYCAQEVVNAELHPGWNEWANNWLRGHRFREENEKTFCDISTEIRKIRESDCCPNALLAAFYAIQASRLSRIYENEYYNGNFCEIAAATHFASRHCKTIDFINLIHRAIADEK